MYSGLKMVIVCIALLLVSSSLLPAAQQYVVTDLGTLGGAESKAFDVNDFGQVSGYGSVANEDFHACVWNGQPQDLGVVFGASQKIAFSIANGGQVAGIGYNYGDLNNIAFAWQNGMSSLLGSFAARSLSESGSIVGYLSTSGSSISRVDHACLWMNGVLTDLGTLGGANSYASDVNSNGQIVGMSYRADDTTRRASLWRNWSVVDLGTLGGTHSQAYAINDHGQVVGVADTPAGAAHGFMFGTDAAGNVVSRQDLGTLGAGYSYAYDINNAGQVVGTSGRAFLWENGAITDLNTVIPTGSGWMLAAASSINEIGQIAGWGMNPTGQLHGFLLTPAGAGVAGAKATPDGTIAPVASAVVTAVFPDCFYMEDPSRASGIRVEAPSYGVALGETVLVTGALGTTANYERYMAATAVYHSGTGDIAPLGMPSLSVGGSSLGYSAADGSGQRGITGASGLNNIGLLVRTWGRFQMIDSSTFTIDDGGVPVKCVVPAGVVLNANWSYVGVTGISSCELVGSELHRLIRVRGASDIAAY